MKDREEMIETFRPWGSEFMGSVEKKALLGTVPKFLHLPRNGHARISPRPPPSPLETGDLQLSDTV